MNDETPHILQRWVSLGDVLVLCASIIGIAMSYGKLSADLASVTREVQELQDRDITPGARAAMSELRAQDASQDAQIDQLRDELKEQRQEMIGRLDRIELALQTHDRR